MTMPSRFDERIYETALANPNGNPDEFQRGDGGNLATTSWQKVSGKAFRRVEERQTRITDDLDRYLDEFPGGGRTGRGPRFIGRRRQGCQSDHAGDRIGGASHWWQSHRGHRETELNHDFADCRHQVVETDLERNGSYSFSTTPEATWVMPAVHLSRVDVGGLCSWVESHRGYRW